VTWRYGVPMPNLILLLAAEAAGAEEGPEIGPFIYGGTALVVLLLLLFVVTRFNIDR